METTNSTTGMLDFDLNNIRNPVEFNFLGTQGVVSRKDEVGVLVAELDRKNVENKRLSEMLATMCEKYSTLQSHVMELTNKNRAATKRRALSDDINSNLHRNNESSSSEDSNKKPRIDDRSRTSKASIRTDPSDTSLIFKDGYQWRKYGQKVTRDNPCPRAYFKCSFAPSCPVKKKVQRSVEDRSVLVATYDGKHNHPSPSQAEATFGLTQGGAVKPIICSTSVGSSGPSITLDLTQPGLNNDNNKSSQERIDQSPAYKQMLVDQMASSLSNDPSFKAALAAAISGRMLQNPDFEKW